MGMAAGDLMDRPRKAWGVLFASLGGLLVGGAAKILGVGAFRLLLGHASGGVTGGVEGAVLGAALALGLLLGGGAKAVSPRRPVWATGLGSMKGLLFGCCCADGLVLTNCT